jgi:hypothetical protein
MALIPQKRWERHISSVAFLYDKRVAAWPKCASHVCHETSPLSAPIPTQADRADYVVSDIEPVFAATPVIARRASAETDSEIAASY